MLSKLQHLHHVTPMSAPKKRNTSIILTQLQPQRITTSTSPNFISTHKLSQYFRHPKQITTLGNHTLHVQIKLKTTATHPPRSIHTILETTTHIPKTAPHSQQGTTPSLSPKSSLNSRQGYSYALQLYSALLR